MAQTTPQLHSTTPPQKSQFIHHPHLHHLFHTPSVNCPTNLLRNEVQVKHVPDEAGVENYVADKSTNCSGLLQRNAFTWEKNKNDNKNKNYLHFYSFDEVRGSSVKDQSEFQEPRNLVTTTTANNAPLYEHLVCGYDPSGAYNEENLISVQEKNLTDSFKHDNIYSNKVTNFVDSSPHTSLNHLQSSFTHPLTDLNSNYVDCSIYNYLKSPFCHLQDYEAYPNETTQSDSVFYQMQQQLARDSPPTRQTTLNLSQLHSLTQEHLTFSEHCFTTRSLPPTPFSMPASKRTIFSQKQLERLEERFLSQSFLSKEERLMLGEELDLTERQVMIWFQNRRFVYKGCLWS